MLYKGDWKRDPQLSMCSPSTRGIWIDLLCDMDDLGSCSITGTASMIARMCRSSSEEVVLALKELKDSGAADVSEENNVFTVKCRRLEKELHISKVRSEAVQSRYKKSSKEDTKGVHLAEDENEDEIEEVVNEKKCRVDAEKIYSNYPRKVAKGAALKAIDSAFKRLCRGEIPSVNADRAEDFLLHSVERYAKSDAGNRGKFTPHPATWFNESRYADDEKEWTKPSNSTDSSPEPAGQYVLDHIRARNAAARAEAQG